jgi:WD40 repeat protein
MAPTDAPAGVAHLFDGQRLRELDTGSPRHLRWAAWQPARSGGGSLALLVGNQGTALLYDGARFHPVPTDTTHNLRGVGWSPDGKMALLVGNRGCALLYHDEGVETLASPTLENLRRVAWHPRGDYALIVGNAGTVLRYEPGHGGAAPSLWHLPGDRAHTLRSLAFRPDGAYALVGAYASRWVGYPRPHALYRCDGRFLQALLSSDDEDDLVAVDWRPDGAQALVVGYAWSGSGRPLNKLLTYDGSGFSYRQMEAPGLLWGVGWHPSGRYALLLGEAGAAFHYEEEHLKPLTTETKDNLVGPFWKPDGSCAIILKGPGDKVYTI